MLLLVEHDRLLRTKAARECFVRFLIGWTRDDLTVVIFRSAHKRSRHTERLYPNLIRHRLTITPATPRDSNLPYWLHYELCCTRTALRYAGVLSPDEPWLAVTPPQWMPALRRSLRARQILSLDGDFNAASVPLLERALDAQREARSRSRRAKRPAAPKRSTARARGKGRLLAEKGGPRIRRSASVHAST
jgi:hypothetical protein